MAADVSPDDPIVPSLRERLRAIVAPHLPQGEAYALLGYPAYANVGDSAIWLGALALLRAHGAGRPRYTCTAHTFDAEALRRQVPRGTLLLTGGGNFGDLYPSHQRMREQVVQAFPGHRIVQLPQTIHYRDERALAASRRVLEAHDDFTLLVRDDRSLALAREGLGVRSAPCPDLAFALGPRAVRRAPDRDVVWLLREDHERAPAQPRGPRPPAAVDWPAEPRRGLFGLQRRLRRSVAKAPARRTRKADLLQRTFAPVARARVHAGIDLLASGRAVVTDRLHGHVLCVLLAIPHVFLDNSYGKNKAFHERWTAGVPTVRWSSGAEETARHLEDLASATA